MSEILVKTPCIGLCSTVYGDLVCRGCKRFHHEVVGWNAYGSGARQAIMQRLETLLVQVMQDRMRVFDTALLRTQLEQKRIPFRESQSAYCWAYQLLARGAQRVQRLQAYGIALLPAGENLSLTQLRDAIDRDFFELSEAYYQRYVAPGLLCSNGAQL